MFDAITSAQRRVHDSMPIRRKPWKDRPIHFNVSNLCSRESPGYCYKVDKVTCLYTQPHNSSSNRVHLWSFRPALTLKPSINHTIYVVIHHPRPPVRTFIAFELAEIVSHVDIVINSRTERACHSYEANRAFVYHTDGGYRATRVQHDAPLMRVLQIEQEARDQH